MNVNDNDKMKKISFSVIAKVIIAILMVLIILNVFDDGNDKLGGGYYYASDSSCDIHGPQIVIPPFIANYNYDKRFIIVKQILNGNPARIYLDSYEYNYPSLHGIFYWIIDKESNKYYGPLIFEDFINKCDSLNVKITFDPEKEFEFVNPSPYPLLDDAY